MEYKAPKDKNYIAEGNVIVSLEEYNKLNDAMEALEAEKKALKRNQKELKHEQNKLNKAIQDNMFLHTHTHDLFKGYDFLDAVYDTYKLSENAEELLKPVAEKRTKEAMKKAYKEFANMTWKQFIQWRKSYREDIFYNI